jgi:tetratricopeptide (TPR) repeat protein
MQVPDLRDPGQAERWYRRSLELREEGDRLGRGKCMGQLGLVAYGRFEEARKAGRPEDEVLRHLNEAARFYHEALNLFPEDALNDLAVTHNQLGNIYDDAGDLERALLYYSESIRYRESAKDVYGAAQTRVNVAVALANSGRFTDALAYAQEALRNYQTFGDRAADKIQKTQGLIAIIEQYLATQKGGERTP